MSTPTSRVLVLTSDSGGVGMAYPRAYAILAVAGATRGGYIQPELTPQGIRHWECAFELLCDGSEGEGRTALLHRLREARYVQDHPIDVNIVPAGPQRRKKLLVADMESTIIEQEMLDELGDFIGARQQIEEITARAMRGELDFEAAIDARVALLKGLDAGVLDEVAARMTLMPGAAALVATMKAHGAYCALVSGGFTVFTGRIAARLGFDEHRANVLEIANGRLTGRVVRPILGGAAKLAALQELTARLGLTPEQTIAVGDGANDIPMLEAAGLGVAFRAKPKVRETTAALPNGAVITHGDLTALLHLQGISGDEIALGRGVATADDR